MVLKPVVFEPGSAVEVRAGGCGFGGSWFSGNIVSRVDSDRFLVHYHNLAERAVVGLHRLRPLPPPEHHREFKSGDDVEAFRKDRWWEGCVMEDLGNGRFVVSFKDSEEMVLPKELMRTPRDWINHSWISPIPNKRDMISELPDNILLHVMHFMETREAVQTCVFSKRWMDLCKKLTSLIFSTDHYPRKSTAVENLKKFASWVLFSRDDTISLHNLAIDNWTEPELLDRVIIHALNCNVQDLKMDLISGFRPNFESLPLIFCCQSLTSLRLCHGGNASQAILPKCLQLPALKSLHLGWVQFTASDNDSAEPFSNCHVLNTLVLECCSLHNDAQFLRISNSTLSNLKIFGGQACQFVLSSPSICSFTIRGSIDHKLFSTCNLSSLGEVKIDVNLSGSRHENSLVIMKWLQVLANVKILTFYPVAFQTILYELSNLISTGPQPPSFVRLESLIVNKHSFPNMSDKELNTLVGYLLQNSPVARVDIING